MAQTGITTEEMKRRVAEDAKEYADYRPTSEEKADSKDVKYDYQVGMGTEDTGFEQREGRFIVIGPNDSKRCVAVGQHKVYAECEYIYTEERGAVLHLWIDEAHLALRGFTTDAVPTIVGNLMLIPTRKEERTGFWSSGIVIFAIGSKVFTYYSSDLPGKYYFGKPETKDNVTKLPITLEFAFNDKKSTTVGEVVLIKRVYLA